MVLDNIWVIGANVAVGGAIAAVDIVVKEFFLNGLLVSNTT